MSVCNNTMNERKAAHAHMYNKHVHKWVYYYSAKPPAPVEIGAGRPCAAAVALCVCVLPHKYVSMCICGTYVQHGATALAPPHLPIHTPIHSTYPRTKPRRKKTRTQGMAAPQLEEEAGGQVQQGRFEREPDAVER